MSSDILGGITIPPSGTPARWIFDHYIGPRIRVSQAVINESELSKALADGHTFVQQLQSGKVVVEKNVNMHDIMTAGLKSIGQK